MASPPRDRDVPGPLSEAWELALYHPDPLIALAAARVVRAHLADWEAALAVEAVDRGATWEMIGETMGASRQAAWERYHERVSARGRGAGKTGYEADVARLRAELQRLKRRARETRRLVRDPSRGRAEGS